MKTFLHKHLIKCKIAVTFKRPGNKTKRVAYLMTNNSIFSPLNLDFKQQLLLTNYDLSVMGIYLYVLYDVLVEWRISLYSIFGMQSIFFMDIFS